MKTEKEKKRPSLDDLQRLPSELLFLEAAQVGVDAAKAGHLALEIEASDLMNNPDISPEKVIALREKLQRASGSTVV